MEVAQNANVAAQTQQLDLTAILMGLGSTRNTELTLTGITPNGDYLVFKDNAGNDGGISPYLLQWNIAEGNITQDGNKITCERGFKLDKYNVWNPRQERKAFNK